MALTIYMGKPGGPWFVQTLVGNSIQALIGLFRLLPIMDYTGGFAGREYIFQAGGI